jgi:hypothetical protein
MAGAPSRIALDDAAGRIALGQRAFCQEPDIGCFMLAEHRHDPVHRAVDAMLFEHRAHVLVIVEIGVRHQIEWRYRQAELRMRRMA